ncbi:AAA domain family protein [Mycobacterium ulcerans str. Harvey]|uniref:AAA domain family protein n=1 Tax=Mycobacterium ulcerans str. Harvey TaxID=1299332 RepID=A0ABP3AMG6_MYCUL|nr:AAA domain family protein [Mycobacterium ulcerans str. Harvey]
MTSAGGGYSGPGGIRPHRPMRRLRVARTGWPPRYTPRAGNFRGQAIIVGQDQLVERMLVGLLAKGHVLLEGVPGVAKTLAVETFARVVGGSFARIQFTPDLVPTDIVGTRIYRQGKEEFDTELGPVVANFLLADEINRAPAKVQSALLEVMAERHVSIGGKTFRCPTLSW